MKISLHTETANEGGIEGREMGKIIKQLLKNRRWSGSNAMSSYQRLENGFAWYGVAYRWIMSYKKVDGTNGVGLCQRLLLANRPIFH